MIRIHIQLAPALGLLATLAARLSPPGELLAPAVPIVAGAIERNFDEEGRPLPWPSLVPATLRRKPAGLKILERSGRLRRSIQTRTESSRLVASTDLPYAAAHQFGAPRRHLPARPFLVLTPTDTEAIAQSVADSLSATDHGSRVTGREQ